MPKIIKAEYLENKFIIDEAKLSDFSINKATFKVRIPKKAVEKYNLKKETKLKVTVEVIED